MAIIIDSQKLCNRCGNPAQEKHHKKLKSEGGSNEESNLILLCKACHDYAHSKRKILKQLNLLKKKRHPKKAKTSKQIRLWKIRNARRIRLWEHRLAVLELLNTEETIKSTGKYTSYWIDKTTR